MSEVNKNWKCGIGSVMNQMSVRKKLAIMFAATVIILGFSIGFQSYESSRTMVIENKKNEMSDTINRIDININFWALNVGKFAERTVERQLSEDVFTGDSQSRETMQEWFVDYAQIIEAVSDVAVFDDQGKMVYHYLETEDKTPDCKRLELCYQKALADPEGESWLDMGCALYSEQEVVTMVKAVPSETKDKIRGILVIELNPDVFKSLLLNNQSVASNQYMLIVDKAGQIVCGSDKIQLDWLDEVEKIFKEGSQNFEFNLDRESYYICGQYNGVTGWKTYSIVSIDDIFPQLSELKKSISFLVAITVLIALYFVLLFSYTFTKPITKLLDGMHEVQQENFDVEILDSRRDEFGLLFSTFNFMVRKIKQLICEVYQEKISQKNAEIKALQAQINPHFLYNTLDSINWMLIERGEMDISDVVISLGSILRYSISGKEGMVPLQDEMQYTDSYLCIQKNRMEERLNYQLDVAEDTLHYIVPKLILQPIVENAVLHGIEPKLEGGTVRVQSFLKENFLVISVKDDGVGMPEEKLEKLRAGISGDDEQYDRIGMKNIQRRLELCFGAESHMEIESSMENGTEVILWIAQTKMREGVENGSCDY